MIDKKWQILYTQNVNAYILKDEKENKVGRYEANISIYIAEIWKLKDNIEVGKIILMITDYLWRLLR